jgi:predicted alpha/beta-hydrolase family hydrolase
MFDSAMRLRAAYTGRVELKVYSSDQAFAALVLAHGAGAGQSSAFMVRVSAGLSERGLSVATFDFPYIRAGRKVPDRAPVLEGAWREAIDAARRQFDGMPLYIGGKSMGGRIASQVASQGVVGSLAGLIFLGYPLHPPGRPDQRRDAHLPAIAERMLFVQGSRDAFGSSDEIRQLLPALQNATLQEIEGGDHSFKVAGGASRQEPVLAGIMDGVATWARQKR